MKKILLAFSTLLILGCATTKKYEAILDSWLNSTEERLILSWGPPNDVYQLDRETKYLTYQSSDSMFIPGSAPSYQTYAIGNTLYTNSYGGTPSQNIQLFCKTTFTLKNQIITGWRYNGNNCKSR